jgi:oligopeptidase B
MRIVTLLILFVVIAMLGCQTRPEPPRARVEPTELERHGDVRIDDYYWLNQREDPEVLAYLQAENEYTRAILSSTEDLQEQLFEEIKGRIKQDDSTAPFLDDGFYYYARYEDGKEYRIYCRKKGSLDAPEQILYDANARAEGHGFYSSSWPKVTPDGNVMAWAEDVVGRRKYTVRFRNLETGDILDDVIPEVTANIAWANDNRTLFYTKQDPDTLRSYRIYRHVLGTDPAEDVLVYQEDDEEFSSYVFRSRSRKYMMIASHQTLSSEYRYLDADDPTGSFTVFLPREPNHEYDLDHLGGDFFIRTNWDARNFRLMKTAVGRNDKRHWEEILPNRDDVLLEDFVLFDDYLVVEERKEGLLRIRIRPADGTEEHYLDFGEPAYLAYAVNNYETDTKTLRYKYESMTTPDSIYDYDMETRDKTLIKRDEVLGGFDRENYRTERIWATTKDGVRIPISLVYRLPFDKDGTRPLLVYGYGSYGASMNATFSSPKLSLIDRGFVYALAHVRGGQEMGRWWYEDGKLLKKKNTFTDFIACTEHLVAEGYADPDNVFAQGGSAGGLLMGAIVNMRPDLFNGIHAAVPWVDVITTMLDDSIPLTTSEFDEWGDPKEKEYYDYMLSYSPYDQVEAKAYPNMLVTTALQDSQVQYFEPAKWVAKLRARKTDDNLLLLKTDMEAGHGGVSGRYKQYRDTALEYAFFLEVAGIR